MITFTANSETVVEIEKSIMWYQLEGVECPLGFIPGKMGYKYSKVAPYGLTKVLLWDVNNPHSPHVACHDKPDVVFVVSDLVDAGLVDVTLDSGVVASLPICDLTTSGVLRALLMRSRK
jgi:hypothetical protein